MTARAHRILIPLAALLAVLPILLKGPSCGHDFDFHLLSWLEASTQFAHLHYPHWAYTPAFNAGEPRFIFYPPLSWALGAILGLMLPWTLVPAAFTFIALTLSGFTAHGLARRYATTNAATLAAILYLLNPYMLFTAYERTAYGELLAAAWLPLLFSAALAPRVRIVSLALPIALLWLTNAPAAVMSCYTLAILTLLRLALNQENRPRLALTTIAATLLGLTLSAFYLVPAAYERRYIQSDMATISGMRIADNTLFHHMSPVTDDTLAHDVVLHTASLIAILILVAIVLSAITSWVPDPRGAREGFDQFNPLPSSIYLLPLLVALLLTPISLPIWSHTPELRFLQFPWRLTAILSTILLLFAGRALTRLNLTPIRTAIGAAALATALILPAWHTFNQPCDDEDTVPARVALYHSHLGTEPTDEYTPTSADNDALGKSDPPYWLLPMFKPYAPPKDSLYELLRTPQSPNLPVPPSSAPGQAPTHLNLTLSEPEYIVLNRRAFPLWEVTVNGKPASVSEDQRDDGLITIPLPAGHDTIDLTQHPTPDRTLGLALSGIALLTTVALRRKRFHSQLENSKL
jgi:hypothetical protein